MHKIFVPFTAALLWASPAWAGAPTRFVCNESGTTVFETQYSGPRYADHIHLQSFDGTLVKSLLAASERGFRFTGSELTANLSVGRCVATPASTTLLTCDATSLPVGADWIIADYQFTHVRNLGTGTDFSETVQVDRPVIAKTLRQVVTRERTYDPILKRDYTAAHIKLVLSGQSAFGSFNLTAERTLGELVAAADLNPWGTCAFVE